MDKQYTSRGFAYYEFTDVSGDICNVQKSSSAMEDCIWLGTKEFKLKHFKAHQGWKDVNFVNTIEEHYVANNRMQLNREQVAKLIPILQNFVETGEI